MRSTRRTVRTLLSHPNGHLNRAGLILLGLILILLFLPLLAFPLGPDAGLFFVSGQKIIHQGAIHYRDIVDVKPPAIYYLNALAIGLFGDHTVSIRILDIILQLATCAMMFLLIRRVSGDDRVGIVAVILYPLFYLGFNYANTSQVESFVGLLMIPAIGLMMFRRSTRGFLLVGFLCGLSIMLKFTFGVTLIAMLLGDLLLYQDTWRVRIRRWSTIVLGFGVVVALFLIYLLLFDAWDGFLEMQTFLTGYTGMQLSTPGGVVGAIARKLPVMLADEYSLLMLIGTVTAVGVALIGPTAPAAGTSGVETPSTTATDRHDRTIVLLRFLTIAFLLLVGSIAVEGKWVHYHLLRLGWCGTMLTAFALIHFARLTAGRARNRFRTAALLVSIPLLLLFSPLTRYVYHVRPSLLLLTDGADAFDAYYAHDRVADDWRMEEIDSIGEHIRLMKSTGDKLYISSGVAGLLYYRARYVPDLPIYHSGFLIAGFAPDRWRDTTAAWLLAERPRFVVLQKSDRMSLITGTEETSIDIFRRMPKVWEMFETEYRVGMETPAFLLYEHVAK